MIPTTPIAATISPPRIRLRLLPTFSTADSRIAANGETRPVRSAGMTADRTVTNVPSTNVSTTVRGSSCNEVDGKSMPRTPRNRLERDGHPDAGDEAQQRTDDADDDRLQQHRPRDLALAARRPRAAARSRVGVALR